MHKIQSIVAAVSLGTAALLVLPAFNATTNAAGTGVDSLAPQAWGTLHASVASWDMQNSLAALAILKRSSDRCTTNFANELEESLRAKGSDGFRDINTIKINLIEDRNCDLVLVDYEFSPLPFRGADQLNLKSSYEKEQWITLHTAMIAWDVEASRDALAVLEQSPDDCVASFAQDLDRRLMLEGENGLQHVNPIKQHYINRHNCQLPLISYAFSPLDFPMLSSLSIAMLWEQLHEAVEVWDIKTTQQTLLELHGRAIAESSQEQQCIASFADRLTTSLDREGTQGFREINLIKTTLNTNQGCNLPVVFFPFAPTPIGQGEDDTAKFETWDRLHDAVDAWDMRTTRAILDTMEQSADICISGFAGTLQRELDVAGKEGFRQITPIKRRYNNALDCTLPLVDYTFSPVF